ncbi:hypothetical protein E2C01_035327 [Portunus trituberculatus]|uniref:Uncharacterized protein n=1 Tax=Portunus trituberculatus TaxID=210409 RepID=A0A5B7F818_PORTR|nr:hypothetical protein [Portunus trituberculatus]
MVSVTASPQHLWEGSGTPNCHLFSDCTVVPLGGGVRRQMKPSPNTSSPPPPPPPPPWTATTTPSPPSRAAGESSSKSPTHSISLYFLLSIPPLLHPSLFPSLYCYLPFKFLLAIPTYMYVYTYTHSSTTPSRAPTHPPTPRRASSGSSTPSVSFRDAAAASLFSFTLLKPH